MPKMTTCLWFDNEAHEAARFYCSVFKKSKILDTARVFITKGPYCVTIPQFLW